MTIRRRFPPLEPPRIAPRTCPLLRPTRWLRHPSDAAASAAVRDGSIDSNLLSSLESEATANPTPTAVARVVAAESAAAQFEISVGDFERAVAHYNVGLRFDPDNVGLLLGAAYLHLRRSEYSAALGFARPRPPHRSGLSRSGQTFRLGVLRIEPRCRRRHAMEARHGTQARRGDAARPGKSASATPRRKPSITKARRPIFASNTTAEPLRSSPQHVLKTLEAEFDEIAATLNYVPPEPIGVILYTNQTFTDITRAPSWSGALNDGRIRVPVEGLTVMTDELARVLKHELTHSFVGQKTGGRCPVWLQEGIAQYMEGKRSRGNAGALSAAFESHMEFSLLVLRNFVAESSQGRRIQCLRLVARRGGVDCDCGWHGRPGDEFWSASPQVRPRKTRFTPSCMKIIRN